jgi:hypothetical protein
MSVLMSAAARRRNTFLVVFASSGDVEALSRSRASGSLACFETARSNGDVSQGREKKGAVGENQGGHV